MKLQMGKATIPLWAAVTVIVSLLIAGGSIYYGWAQAIANADHKIILQKQQQDENEIGRLEEITVSNTHAIADIGNAMTKLTTQVQDFVAVVRDGRPR